jgi:hypothetical protein
VWVEKNLTSAGAVNGQGTTAKYLRGAAGIGPGTTVKHLLRTTRLRPGHHDQVPATHNERRRGPQPEPIQGTTDVLIHHKRPHLPVFVRASVASKQDSITELRI